MSRYEGPLGRIEPTDLDHVEKYPLTAAKIPDKPTPVVIGINWYSAFDSPVQDDQGKFWIGRDGNLGSVRGGHCVCLKPPALRDYVTWWEFYNQGVEGACVGFGWSRAQSLQNRARYDGFWLYHEAQKIDEWPGESYDGTSVRAGGDILRDRGHRLVKHGVAAPEDLKHGIEANLWCRSMEDVHAVLKSDINLGYVTILNSWGKNGYPHYTRMTNEVADRVLFREGGDATIITDRP